MNSGNSQGWRRIPFVSLCDAHVDCVNRTAPIVEGSTPFKMIRTTNVRDGFVDTKNVRYVAENTFHRWTRRLAPRRGDVLLTREAPLGGVGKIRTDEQIFLGQRLYHFRANPKLADADFLLYSLMGPDLQAQIRSFGSGSTVEHMRLPDIEKLEVNAPGLAEQQRIGAALAAYDDLIENCERRIRVLDEMARRFYREWFVNFRYPEHETVPLVDSHIGQIPKGWSVARAGSIAVENRRSIAKGELEATMPYVGLEHIPRRSVALNAWEVSTDLGSNKLLFKRGEVLFGKIRPYFHKVSVAPFDGICSADTIVISAKDAAYYGLVVCVTSSDGFVAHANASANGAKMPRASWNVMTDFSVALPPRELAQQFNDRVVPLFLDQQTLVFQAQNLRKTRALLLPRLLSGHLSIDVESAA